MKADLMRYFPVLTILFFVACSVSCSGRSGRTSGQKSATVAPTAVEPAPTLFKLTSPGENADYKLHGQIRVVLDVEKKYVPDSVRISFDGQLAGVLRSEPWEFNIPSALVTGTGRKSLKVIAYKSPENIQTVTRFLIILSDTKPKRYGYRIIHTYPHDREAFTQGLVYDNGFFYEGTGQLGTSWLRKVDPATGKVLQQLNLDPQLFGEGIAILGDKIYQLTWESKVGFVYDKSTFKLINKIYYQTEGWGLTTIGNKLVMSDGTNNLYFMDPEEFSVISKIEVYDNEKKVDKLNELEYINGEIWANIWQTNLIARIDPSSGKVLGYIDLTGILSDPDTDTSVNVLNGIAYDKVGKRIFVTGKNWPKLFEIAVTE